jgi:EAL domain-containing protein (putative c-di-GMP-specific phosphodiesterase class I)
VPAYRLHHDSGVPRGAQQDPSLTAPPTSRSNRLSDAPSALGPHDKREAQFFGRLANLDDFSTVFQPVVRLDDGRLFGYEALVRCPVRLTPTGLFAQAATSHSAGRLGRMIREIAVSLCSGVPLFVNLHPSELEEGWLVRPDDPIFSHDDDIYLEISESVPMTHSDLCESVLAAVCARTGVYLVVDDFGAGYSNLQLISDLAPKMVKLDRKLVENLHRDPRKHTLVSGVVRLCGELGAEVVAEGIETVDELSAVRDTGAQYGQGYLLGRPGFPIPPITWPPPPSEGETPTIPPPPRTPRTAP